MNILRTIIRIAAAALAWVLFGYWWQKVSRPSWTPPSFITVTLVSISVALIAIALLTTLWIFHNLQIAKRGRRGKLSLYFPPKYENDFLGRTLRIPAPPQEGYDRLLIIEIDEHNKFYRRESELARRHPGDA